MQIGNIKIWFTCLILLTSFILCYSQSLIKIKVVDAKSKSAQSFVTISENNQLLGNTDSLGKCNIKLTDGVHSITFSLIGFETLNKTINVPNSELVEIELNSSKINLEEVVIVSSSRNNSNIENSTLKVEVLGKEELGEEASIKPGNIASILGDVSGVQIQQSSATSGNSNVRIQGLDGRYTQLLRDGMPLFEGFAGGFGILSIPPLDLQQIELVKGSASTLYGGGAIGGLINLISRKPKMQQEADILLNATTLKEFNGNVFLANRNAKFGYSLFAGNNRQYAVDVDKDGFSDLPDATSYIFHPKLFYYPNEKTTVSIGYSGVMDSRIGGDLFNNILPYDPYTEKNASNRNTGEYLFEQHYNNNIKLTIKGSASNFNRTIIVTNQPTIQANQINYYNEASAYIPIKKSNLVCGVNFVGDDYKTIKPSLANLKYFNNKTLGSFAQFSWHLNENSTVETGIRIDNHFKYGIFVLPRFAVFKRFDKHWASRAGYGAGYKTPNPLVQQNIDYNVLQLQAINNLVVPEKSNGFNAEVNYKYEFNDESSLFINQAFFYTQIVKPIQFRLAPIIGSPIFLNNASNPTISRGSDTYIKLKYNAWELYAGYTYTYAVSNYKAIFGMGNEFLPLTPKHRFAFVAVYEIEHIWRFGLEGSFTGKQFRYDRSKTPAYFFGAAMVQRNIGKHFIVVLNCENLFDFRMSKVESLYVGSKYNPTFKPLWAPIDGRVVNLSIRWKL